MKLLSLCLAPVIGLCLTSGQLTAAQTNVVQVLNLRGTLLYQGSPLTNSTGTTVTRSTIRTPFNNRVLIDRFAQVAGTTFTSAAKLLVVSALDGSDEAVVVQDGTNRLDVSTYFEANFDTDPTVETESRNLSTGTVSATRYQLVKVKVKEDGAYGKIGLQFEVEGLATIKRKTLFVNGEGHVVDRPTGKLAGDGKSANLLGGDSDFLALITFSVSGGSVEVRP